jgi:tetratricopeptide (TPR) repeat protein
MKLPLLLAILLISISVSAADIHQKLQRYEERGKTDSYSYYMLRGRVAVEDKDYQKAYDSFTKALEKRPDDAQAKKASAWASYMVGNYGESSELYGETGNDMAKAAAMLKNGQYEEVLSIMDGSTEESAKLGYSAAVKLKDYKRAKEYAEKLVAFQPSSSDYLHHLMTSAIADRDYFRAADVLDEMKKIGADTGLDAENQSRLYENAGYFEKAAKALQEKPDYDAGRLAGLYLDAGDDDRAKEILTRRAETSGKREDWEALRRLCLKLKDKACVEEALEKAGK